MRSVRLRTIVYTTAATSASVASTTALDEFVIVSASAETKQIVVSSLRLCVQISSSQLVVDSLNVKVLVLIVLEVLGVELLVLDSHLLQLW